MLQRTTPVEDEAIDFGKFLKPKYYLEIARRRLLYFLIPLIVIGTLGTGVVMLLPAMYLAQGKVLVQSQQIPSELVRPTVTTLAAERVSILEQRLMTRDNVLSIVDKFRLFNDRRSLLTTTDIVDLVRERTRITPIQLSATRTPTDRATIAFQIGFEHEDPDVAMRVASELITLILNEDARNRTSRATDTTRFLAREAKRLQTELAAVETQIAEVRRARAETTAGSAGNQSLIDRTNSEIATLKADLIARRAQYSNQHPEVQLINRKLTALEKAAADSSRTVELENGLDVLQRQHAALKKSSEEVGQKLTAAQMGEALERDQQAEKLEVIEQPTRPQEAIKPKRGKLLAVVVALALMAGAGLAGVTEIFDNTIRSQADLWAFADSQLVSTVPLVETPADINRHRKVVLLRVGIAAACAIVLTVGFALVAPPPDILWQQVKISASRFITR